MGQDLAYNLSALAERLLKEGQKAELVRIIQSAVDARSIEVDLINALEACDALTFSLDNPLPQPANFRETSEAALLSYIAVLYTRATKSKSDVRRQYDPRAKFTDAERIVHRELCDLRDKAVAHFGHGGSYAGNWAIELAILDVHEQSAKPAVVSRRLVVDRALLLRARNQIERTLAIIEPVSLQRLNGIIEALDAEFEADPDFYKELKVHPLNLAVFLGGEDCAAQMLAGRDARKARGAFGQK